MKQDTHGFCRTCRGSGSVMSHGFPLEWWPCPACGGHGARHQFGPAKIGPDQ